MLLMLFVINLVFSALISFPQAVEALSRWLTYFVSSPSSPAEPPKSSAKHRLLIVLPPMLTVPLWPSKVSVMILSRNMLLRVGERDIPIGLQLLFGISPLCCHRRDCTDGLVIKVLLTQIRLALMLYFMVAQKAVRQMLSKAFLKSMKTW